MEEQAAYTRILVINLGGIGDLLLSTPAAKALRKAYPGATICLLSVPRVAGFAREFPCFDQVYTLRLGGIGGILHNAATLWGLRGIGFDLAINMRTIVSGSGARKMKRLLGMINAKINAGRNTDGRGGFFDISIAETKQGEKFEREYDIDLMRALGVNVDDTSIEIPLDEKVSQETQALLGRYGIPPGRIRIGIHPGGNKAHRWPIDNFAQVVREISASLPKAAFIITGDASDAELGKKLSAVNPDAVRNLAGKLDIRQVCALLKEIDLFIANDTGIMHIAAALRIPLVAIFGPGDLTRFDPRNISHQAAVLYKKAACAPCNLTSCDSLDCLTPIAPTEVAAAALTLLKKHAD